MIVGAGVRRFGGLKRGGFFGKNVQHRPSIEGDVFRPLRLVAGIEQSFEFLVLSFES